MGRRVLFWGRFDHGYSKTRVNAAAFRALGWEVDYFDVKWCCRLGDVEAFFRGLDRRPRPDLVLVPVCRQRDIAAACRWAHKRGIKVLFDPMISAWDKKVLEQKKWKPEERRAKRLLAWEKKLMAMPDFITWDTSCHVDFAAEYLDVPREKMTPLFTGTDEEVFKPVDGELVGAALRADRGRLGGNRPLRGFATHGEANTPSVASAETPLPDHFDKVLVDAPCSNTGVLRRRPDARWNWSEEKLAALVKLQAEILDACAPRVAPGGLLVYSTCSNEPEENEAQVTAFLARHPDFSLEESRESLPFESGTDGAFAARLRRNPA